MTSTTRQIFGRQVKENEMGWVCGTCGAREMLTEFWWGNCKKADHLEDVVGGRIQ
jgi:hypothetical protein